MTDHDENDHDENDHEANGHMGRYAHRPVMEAEIVDVFRSVPPGVVLDATLGGGGHSEALLA